MPTYVRCQLMMNAGGKNDWVCSCVRDQSACRHPHGVLGCLIMPHDTVLTQTTCLKSGKCTSMNVWQKVAFSADLCLPAHVHSRTDMTRHRVGVETATAQWKTHSHTKSWSLQLQHTQFPESHSCHRATKLCWEQPSFSHQIYMCYTGLWWQLSLQCPLAGLCQYDPTASWSWTELLCASTLWNAHLHWVLLHGQPASCKLIHGSVSCKLV